MHAYIIATQSTINAKLQITNLATKHKAKQIPFVLQKIDDLRELKKLVKFSFSEKTAIVIEDIDKITIEAANAFLKNLEEPTKNIIYILTASNLNNVLPTIISRCEIVKVLSTKYKVLSTNADYKDALNIKDREEAIKFIENLVFYFEDQMSSTKRYTPISNHLKLCLDTISALRANGNVSLQLTNFVAKMSSTTI